MCHTVLSEICWMTSNFFFAFSIMHENIKYVNTPKMSVKT